MKHWPPRLETLEDRCVPVTWGNAWPDGAHLTFSFAPDGTIIGDAPSDLQATLDSQAAREAWQLEILRAFQTWAINANINIGLIPDGGQDLGDAGRPQGDTRYGDIRVAGYSLPDDVIAIASPFEYISGTWAGDVRLNTNVEFGINGNGEVDLFSAFLHEAGHVFGIDHSTDPNSPLYENYQGLRNGLTANDIAMLQAMYGARTADANEGTSGNDTTGNATRLSLLTDPDGSLGVAADGDIRTLSDKDYFRFQAPLTLGPLVINLKTEGISLLTAKISVYNSLGQVVGSSATSDPTNNDLSVRINNPSLLGTYYVKIESNTQDVFGIGSYHLEVKSLALVETVGDLLNNTVNSVLTLLNDDLHLNDTFLTASLLAPLTSSVNSQFDYSFKGSIRDSWDVDLYRVTAPHAGANQYEVMSVMVWGLENNGLQPRVSVYDAAHNLVDAEVLINADGIFTVQIRDAISGTSYFVKVEASDPHGEHNIGNYFLGVDFGTQAVELEEVAAGTLSQEQSSGHGILTITESEMLHLVLGVEGEAASVRVNVVDMHGNIITTLTAQAGSDPISFTKGLPSGMYLLHFHGYNADGSPLNSVSYTLNGTRLSDPIGPRPENSTTQPSGSTSSSTTTSGYSYQNAPPPPSSGYASGQTTAPPTAPEPNAPEAEYTAYYQDWLLWYNSASSAPPENSYSDPYTVSTETTPPPSPSGGTSGTATISASQEPSSNTTTSSEPQQQQTTTNPIVPASFTEPSGGGSTSSNSGSSSSTTSESTASASQNTPPPPTTNTETTSNSQPPPSNDLPTTTSTTSNPVAESGSSNSSNSSTESSASNNSTPSNAPSSSGSISENSQTASTNSSNTPSQTSNPMAPAAQPKGESSSMGEVAAAKAAVANETGTAKAVGEKSTTNDSRTTIAEGKSSDESDAKGTSPKAEGKTADTVSTRSESSSDKRSGDRKVISATTEKVRSLMMNMLKARKDDSLEWWQVFEEASSESEPPAANSEAVKVESVTREAAEEASTDEAEPVPADGTPSPSNE